MNSIFCGAPANLQFGLRLTEGDLWVGKHHQPEEVLEGEPEDADGLDEGEAGVVLCLVVGRVAGEEEGGTNRLLNFRFSKNLKSGDWR